MQVLVLRPVRLEALLDEAGPQAHSTRQTYNEVRICSVAELGLIDTLLPTGQRGWVGVVDDSPYHDSIAHRPARSSLRLRYDNVATAPAPNRSRRVTVFLLTARSFVEG